MSLDLRVLIVCSSVARYVRRGVVCDLRGVHVRALIATNRSETHHYAKACDTPGQCGPAACLCGPLQPSTPPAATKTLSMTTVTANAGGRSLQPTQLASGIDAAARPEIDTSRHQSLLVLRRTDRFAKEPGRHLKLGVRKLRTGLACTCRRIMSEKLPAPLLTAMPSVLSGSDTTSATGLFEALTA